MSEQDRGFSWVVTTLLVLLVVLTAVAALAIGYAVGRDQSSDPVTLGEQLEVWTACLREAEANVPLVEARSDGGFTVTVDGSFLEEFDPRALARAAGQCEHVAPSEAFFAQFGGHQEPIFPGRRHLPRPGDESLLPPGLFEELGLERLAELCERLAHAEEIPEEIRELRPLLAACAFIDE